MSQIPEELEASLREAAGRDGVQRLIIGAVIAHDGRVLVLKRAPTDFMPGILELPSGQVDAGETLSEALRREVDEETGLRVTEIGAYLGSFDYLSKSGRLSRQLNFVATVADGPIRLTEHTEYAWLAESELATAWITESTRDTIKAFMYGAGGA